MLMEADKVPFMRLGDRITAPPIGSMAYHIDNKHFLGYLKGKLAVLGCRYLDTEITEVRLAEGSQQVDGLVFADGTARSFDLYIDCSGFRSLLLGSALKTKWIDYSPSLKTDRAVLGMRETPGEIPPYTTAATLRHGWLWNTPMQQEEHLGYVFSSRHCSDDEALAELQTHCKSVQHGRVVKFKTGRHDASWVGNVISIGNSFAFIEPLESTGIHMILTQLAYLSDALEADPSGKTGSEKYNRKIAARWDHLRWYIALHFRYNGKLETPFWQDCRQDADVTGLDEYVEYFKRNGPLSRDPSHPLYEALNHDATFPVFAHDATLAGCGVNETSLVNAEHRRSDAFPARFALNQQLVQNALGHRESLAWLEQNDCVFASPHRA